MLDRNNIREDLIIFINIIKDFENGCNNIKHEDIDYMGYEAMDYEDGFMEYIEIQDEYELTEYDMYVDLKEKDIPDTWLEEIEIFTHRLSLVSTENLILISKIISLGKDLTKNKVQNEKVIIIKNKYLSNEFMEKQDYYEDRDEILEDLFSKKGEKIIKWAELGAETLHIL